MPEKLGGTGGAAATLPARPSSGPARRAYGSRDRSKPPRFSTVNAEQDLASLAGLSSAGIIAFTVVPWMPSILSQLVKVCTVTWVVSFAFVGYRAARIFSQQGTDVGLEAVAALSVAVMDRLLSLAAGPGLETLLWLKAGAASLCSALLGAWSRLISGCLPTDMRKQLFPLGAGISLPPGAISCSHTAAPRRRHVANGAADGMYPVTRKRPPLRRKVPVAPATEVFEKSFPEQFEQDDEKDSWRYGFCCVCL